ncbi:hypothetical protein ES288_D08G227700v1 [Gossypium darwinii]|uniref:RHOMBOID-like protein n=1 Tax=Gossypium darwinii TaxID=34276 RepID=A0A5D2BRY6_GOSDA|nr:hypothetical protein ES288_D08G227700v1 [Gossypium darwinii]
MLLFFFVVMYINDCPNNNLGFEGSCVAKFLGKLSFQPLKENPLFGPSSHTLDKLGALNWDKVVHDKQGWKLITCIWLHAGVIHLLANMLSLVFIGIRLEKQFGFLMLLRIGLIYLLSGFGGSILSSLFIQDNIFLLTNWTIYTNKAAALITLVVIIAINLVVGILPHVDNFAHVGGFLTGFLLGFVLLLRPQFGWVQRQHVPAGAPVKSKHKAYQFTMGLVMLFRGENGNDHCSWCHYLSCVPISSWHCGK